MPIRQLPDQQELRVVAKDIVFMLLTDPPPSCHHWDALELFIPCSAPPLWSEGPGRQRRRGQLRARLRTNIGSGAAWCEEVACEIVSLTGRLARAAQDLKPRREAPMSKLDGAKEAALRNVRAARGVQPIDLRGPRAVDPDVSSQGPTNRP